MPYFAPLWLCCCPLYSQTVPHHLHVSCSKLVESWCCLCWHLTNHTNQCRLQADDTAKETSSSHWWLSGRQVAAVLGCVPLPPLSLGALPAQHYRSAGFWAGGGKTYFSAAVGEWGLWFNLNGASGNTYTCWII